MTVIPNDIAIASANAFFGILRNVDGTAGGTNLDITVTNGGGKTITVNGSGGFRGGTYKIRYMLWDYKYKYGVLANRVATGQSRTLTIPYSGEVASIGVRSFTTSGSNDQYRRHRIIFNSDTELQAAAATLNITLQDFGIDAAQPANGTINVSTNPTISWSGDASNLSFVKILLFRYDAALGTNRVWEAWVYGSTTSITIPSLYTLNTSETYSYDVIGLLYVRDDANNITEEFLDSRTKIFFSTGSTVTPF